MFRVSGLGFRGSGSVVLMFRVSGLGFRGSGSVVLRFEVVGGGSWQVVSGVGRRV